MNPNEMWQAEVNGQVYDAAFSELAAWVGENALLPDDKVRRGNLRWLEAGKVPALMPFFNAKEIGIAPPEIPVSAVDGENADADVQIQTANFAADSIENGHFQDQQNQAEFCVFHPDSEAEFICETCFNNFCEACPQDDGFSGKTCPMCGASVKPVISRTQSFEHAEFPAPNEDFPHSADNFSVQPQQSYLSTRPAESFGFGDFGKALSHPFKYKTSLFSGGLMFMFFTLGQQAFSIGGMFMLFAAIFSAMLANMLTFGVLANVVENFSQWKTETNFMPDFDDFSLWDDVVHPFFLSIGAYIVSFGLFIAIVIGGIWFTISSIGEMQNIEQNSTSAVMPGSGGDMEQLRQMPELQKTVEGAQTGAPNADYDEEQHFQDLEQMIRENRRAQLESVTGPTPEQEQAQKIALLQNMLKTALPLVVFGGLAFLWGLFYFPAACAVAGYTRSFTATINPLVGFDTIKNLGADYAKIVLMSFLLTVMLGVATGILNAVFSPFAMPRVGNIPAIALGSFVTFYFWIVFSCILGYAINKNSDKLGIYRG